MEATTRGDDAVYINKSMPFKEFVGLYEQCREVSLMKEAASGKIFNAKTMVNALKKPGKSARIAAKLLKQKILKK
jgi:hypothetical protein